MAAPRFPDRDVIPLNDRETRDMPVELIDQTDLAEEQFQDAVRRIHLDTSRFPTFPWPDVAELTGPLCPEDVVMAMARTGGGKSLFFQNTFDHLVTAGGQCGMYVGLEQSASILRIKWACMRAKVSPRLVLAAKKHERNTPAWQEAMDLSQDQLKWIRANTRETAMFASARTINARGLKEWTEWAVQRGADFLVLDHIDRVKHGEGRNPFQEMSDTMRLAKELAVEHQLVMLIASQVGRPGDANEAFIPPALHNARGGGTKEEESDIVLGIYRPLKAETTEADMKRVRQGFAKAQSIIEPNQMGVQLLKHRLDAAPLGEAARLAVHHGRVEHLPARHLYETSFDAMRAMGRPS